MGIKDIYCEDEVSLIKEALENYLEVVRSAQKDLTEIDERYELHDLQLKERHLITLLSDFE